MNIHRRVPDLLGISAMKIDHCLSAPDVCPYVVICPTISSMFVYCGIRALMGDHLHIDHVPCTRQKLPASAWNLPPWKHSSRMVNSSPTTSDWSIQTLRSPLTILLQTVPSLTEACIYIIGEDIIGSTIVYTLSRMSSRTVRHLPSYMHQLTTS
jgi:hypothetical protein